MAKQNLTKEEAQFRVLTQLKQGQTIKVSGTLDTVNKAGRKSEKAYQLAKASQEIKRDLETVMLSNQGRDAGSSNSTPRKMASLLSWIKTNTSFGSGGADPTTIGVSTADNDINALKSNGSIPEGYTVNHFLTDTDAWFLTTDVPNGLKHFVRTPMATSMDGDFDTGNVRYKARERYSFGWSDPLGMYGSEGAA